MLCLLNIIEAPQWLLLWALLESQTIPVVGVLRNKRFIGRLDSEH